MEAFAEAEAIGVRLYFGVCCGQAVKRVRGERVQLSHCNLTEMERGLGLRKHETDSEQ